MANFEFMDRRFNDYQPDSCRYYFYFCNNNDKTDSGTPEGEAMDHVYDDDIYEFNNPLPTWWTYLFKGMFVVTALYLILYPAYLCRQCFAMAQPTV